MYAASRVGNVELLMLVSDFMVNSMLKNTQTYFCECMEWFNKNAKKKKKKTDLIEG